MPLLSLELLREATMRPVNAPWIKLQRIRPSPTTALSHRVGRSYASAPAPASISTNLSSLSQPLAPRRFLHRPQFRGFSSTVIMVSYHAPWRNAEPFAACIHCNRLMRVALIVVQHSDRDGRVWRDSGTLSSEPWFSVMLTDTRYQPTSIGVLRPKGVNSNTYA